MTSKRLITASEPLPEPLVRRYLAVRALSVELAARLTVEDQVVQPCLEASPTKWHLGHTSWFFEHFVLRKQLPSFRPVDERYERLFNSYYYTVGEMHPRAERGVLSRPTVAQIQDYRSRIDDAMTKLLESRPDDPQLSAVVELGLNHEQQHQELLLTDAKQVLFANPLDVAYSDAAAPPRTPRTEPLAFAIEPARFAEIGADGTAFAFDNERPRHRVWLESHALANRPVTNGEYREFIRDGAYTKPELWLADGWARLRERGWNRPLCWAADLEREYTLGGWRTLDEHAPVCHVSFYEAAAFAAWAGARLPTEAEWENAAGAQTPVHGNLLETGWLHPAAAAALPSGGGRFLQLWGDVWEWCASAYRPYPRFRPLSGSLGEYNGKFMCNQWVVRGGSCATPAGHVRASYRNFFYPHDRWQFLGFRLARD
ncbi:MAG TPA: ergothioneine biosynthesis protein EgtB, partial [Gammaproteobacteria bacterium]|nr:ergothioneine biosynthesis protein EgtB [Gammaproteobacteria bacterium]